MDNLDADGFGADNDTSYEPGDWNPASGDNFKVVIRVRPPLQRELRGTGLRPYQCTTHVDDSGRIMTLSENLPAVLQGLSGPMDPGMLYATYRFTFDHVYDQHCSQEELYTRSAQQVVLSILQGYNAAIIAYGQTGTGKTYTMEGELTGPLRGIIPRTVEDVFTYIVNDPEPSSKYLVRASYLQIYNEVISDLLKPERSNLVIREDRRRGVFVEGLSEWVVRSPAEVYQLMANGQAMRATGATKLNEVSSRSHAVCIIIVEKCSAVDEALMRNPAASRDGPTPQSIKVGKLNLVDLAGSERVHVTGAVGRRLEESKKINASLSALGNVIAALTDRRGERPHIPYRDSKLTRMLEDSLGGNCRTTMVCTVAPAMDAFQESLSTLKFANRAKNIKNEAHVNEDLDQRTLLRKYERELRKLRAELQRRSKELVDKRALLEVEEQKRRAEADKLGALTALEKRSRELMKEKEEKRALEAKISAMQSQMLVGGVALGGLDGGAGVAGLEEVPAFKLLLQKEHKRIRSEYEARLRELETERQTVEEDRLQVDRYKQLLLKQRDIMIALTTRLNERDEQIILLQEEVEHFTEYSKQLEDQLDSKTSDLITVRKAVAEAAKANPNLLQSTLGAWSTSGGAGAASMSRASSSTGTEADTRTVLDKSSHGGAIDVSRLAASLHNAASMSSMDGGGVPESTSSVSTQMHAQTVGRLVAENQRLAEQVERLEAELQHRGSAAPRPQQQSQAVEVTQRHYEVAQQRAAVLGDRVENLTAACTTAQKERAALQQILEGKVQRLVSELVIELGGAQGDYGAGMASELVVTKMRSLDGVISKITSALKAAPPILPPEDEDSAEYEDEDEEGAGEEGYTNGVGYGDNHNQYHQQALMQEQHYGYQNGYDNGYAQH